MSPIRIPFPCSNASTVTCSNHRQKVAKKLTLWTRNLFNVMAFFLFFDYNFLVHALNFLNSSNSRSWCWTLYYRMRRWICGMRSWICRMRGCLLYRRLRRRFCGCRNRLCYKRLLILVNIYVHCYRFLRSLLRRLRRLTEVVKKPCLE